MVFYLILSFFKRLLYNFFEPVRKKLEERKNKIKDDLSNAKTDKEEAIKLRTEYEAKMKEADKQAEMILQDARKKAQQNEERILRDAKEEASLIKKRAYEEAKLEQNRVRDEIKKQMILVASAMAQKVVSSKMDVSIQDELVDETLKEIGGATWQD